MKARSDIKPQNVTVERLDESCDVILADNITEVTVVDENLGDGKKSVVRKEFEYDSYRVPTYYRDGILKEVTDSFSAWVKLAKDQERAKSIKTPTEQDKLNATLLLKISKLEAKVNV